MTLRIATFVLLLGTLTLAYGHELHLSPSLLNCVEGLVEGSVVQSDPPMEVRMSCHPDSHPLPLITLSSFPDTRLLIRYENIGVEVGVPGEEPLHLFVILDTRQARATPTSSVGLPRRMER